MTAASPALVNDIRAASRKLVRELGFLDRTIAGTDLSASAVHAVLEIGMAPGVTAKDIAAKLKLEKSTISRLLKMLEKRGEIAQVRSEVDGRVFGLHLTPQGKQTFADIDAFGNNQVHGALSRISGSDADTVAAAMAAYADALAPVSKNASEDIRKLEIVEGYQTGMIGDISALHGRTHGPIVGMGHVFETVVAKAMADFVPRLDRPMNNTWSVLDNGEVTGSITIDGEHLGNNIAHLRWFILSEKLRGKGLGKQLLSKALNHCDTLGYEEIHLWTLKGLEPARALYEKNGFELAEEYIGDQWGKAVSEQKFIRKRAG